MICATRLSFEGHVAMNISRTQALVIALGLLLLGIAAARADQAPSRTILAVAGVSASPAVQAGELRQPRKS